MCLIISSDLVQGLSFVSCMAFVSGESIFIVVEFFVNKMLNKNIFGVKKCEANKRQPYLYAIKSFDIS